MENQIFESSSPKKGQSSVELELRRQNEVLRRENEDLVNEILEVMEDFEALQRNEHAQRYELCALQKVVDDLSQECDSLRIKLQGTLLNDASEGSDGQDLFVGDALRVQELKQKLKNAAKEREEMSNKIQLLEAEAKQMEHALALLKGSHLQLDATNRVPKSQTSYQKLQGSDKDISPRRRRQRRKSVSDMCVQALQSTRLVISNNQLSNKDLEVSFRSLDVNQKPGVRGDTTIFGNDESSQKSTGKVLASFGQFRDAIYDTGSSIFLAPREEVESSLYEDFHQGRIHGEYNEESTNTSQAMLPQNASLRSDLSDSTDSADQKLGVTSMEDTSPQRNLKTGRRRARGSIGHLFSGMKTTINVNPDNGYEASLNGKPTILSRAPNQLMENKRHNPAA